MRRKNISSRRRTAKIKAARVFAWHVQVVTREPRQEPDRVEMFGQVKQLGIYPVGNTHEELSTHLRIVVL